MTGRGTKKYHHGDLRHALIEAALELIAEKGPEGFTLRETARRVGVSHTAPYRHFADKETLLAAVAEQGFRLLYAATEAAALAHADEIDGGFSHAGVAYVDFAIAHPSHFRVMFAFRSDDEHAGLAEAGGAAFTQFTDSILAAQQAGAVREGDPMAIALAAWAFVHGLATLAINGALDAEVFGDREAIRAKVQPLIWTGIGRDV